MYIHINIQINNWQVVPATAAASEQAGSGAIFYD